MREIAGKCACGEPYIKVEQSTTWTPRTDKTNYIRPGDRPGSYDVFRCGKCLEPIEHTFIPAN